MVTVNFGSIGIVSGVKAEQAKKYLTDLFAILIETNRKHNKEVRLNFRQLGSLCLYKNGELSFTTLDDSQDQETLSLISARMKPR